jgi:hypothetical protein
MPIHSSSRAGAFVSPMVRLGLRHRDQTELQGVSLDSTDEKRKASLRNRVLSGGGPRHFEGHSNMNNRKSSHV